MELLMGIDMIDIMQWLGISMLAVVVYVMAFNTTSSRLNRHYSVPNWNFTVKKIWAQRMLRKKLKNEAQKTADFQNLKREQVSSANDLYSSTLIYGDDVSGNSLLISLHKGKDLATELTMILRLSDGKVYTMPKIVTSTLLPWNVNVAERCEINGLTFECLQPYRKWRITYSGLLMVRQTGTEIEERRQFVKFNFFWSHAGILQHWPSDWSPSLQAAALAAEPWRNAFWLDYLQTCDYGGFDQFGSLFGQVHLNQVDGVSRTVELNLPGVRQRRWTSYEMEKCRRSCSIVGVCPDGTLYILGAHSLERNLSNAQYGYIRTSNGEVAPIDWTDFHLSEFAENPQNVTKAISIRFSANRKMFASTIYADQQEHVPVWGSIPRRWSGSVFGAKIGVNGEHGQGIILLTQVVKSTPTTPKVFRNHLKYSEHRPTRTKIAYWLSDSAAQSEHISGGKGASLALLVSVMQSHPDASLHYKVPTGFVLSVSAFDLQLSMNPTILNDIKQVEDIALERIEGDLESTCTRVCNSIADCPLVPEVEQSIAKFYRDMRSKNLNLRLAVRSSAIGEDGEDTSSAGQNETFLGLSSVNEVWRAVRECWASLYTYRSVEYRRNHLQPIVTQMAVVVQTMVSSESAGVLFTKHPTTGDPSQTLITANYGLGESVVSGAVDPDTFIVSRSNKYVSASILDMHLGSKLHAIRMSSDDGTSVTVTQTVLRKSDQQRQCITNDQVLRLAKIGEHLEQLYGNSRDIEWAYFEDVVYLLQSRPITTLNRMSNWELLHEMDMAVMSKDDLYTFANLGEIFPECTTPLTLSTIKQCLSRNTTRFFKSNIKYAGAFDAWYCNTHYRSVMEVYPLLLRYREKDISIADKMTSITVCGHEYVSPEIHQISLKRNGVGTKLDLVAHMWQAAKGIWRNKANVNKLSRFIENYSNRFSGENLKEFKDHDAEQFLAEINFELDDPDRLDEAFLFHLMSSHVSSFTQVIAMTILTEGSLGLMKNYDNLVCIWYKPDYFVTDITTDHYTDIGLMLGSCKDVESGEVPIMLEDISNAIYLAGYSDTFIELLPHEGEQWLYKTCAKAGSMFRNFIQRHGHRSIKELELSAKTWSMQPEVIIEMLQTTCRHAKNVLDVKPKKRVLSNEEILCKLKTPKKPSTRKVLSYILPLVKMSVQRRESTKSGIIAYVHELRKAYLHLADLLFKDGLLPDRELLFYLDRHELEKLVAKPSVEMSVNKSRLVAKAQRRMRLFPQWNSLKFDEFHHGLVRPITEDATDLTGLEMVSGTSVNEGFINGRACVITSFADVGLIQAGDILVTLCTDIGWSTYFPILGGVVTELGGLISHGAVVAREYGIPCIVGATGATRVFKHGDQLTLNATKGLLFRTPNNESDA